MKNFATTCKLLATLTVVLVASTGCESSGDSHAHVHGSMYYGVGFYDPWYYGPGYYPPTVVVPPPNRPDSGPRPEHPIARPTPTPRPTPRPTPSIPSMPRPSGRR